MKFTVFNVLIVLFLCSCTHTEKAREDKLYQEVMDIHDEVMPKMGEVMWLEKELDKNIDQLKSTDSTPSRPSRIEQLTTLKKNLSDADEYMMNWMREFNNDMDGMTHEEKIDYLEKEKQKIQKVKSQVNMAIQNAQEAID